MRRHWILPELSDISMSFTCWFTSCSLRNRVLAETSAASRHLVHGHGGVALLPEQRNACWMSTRIPAFLHARRPGRSGSERTSPAIVPSGGGSRSSRSAFPDAIRRRSSGLTGSGDIDARPDTRACCSWMRRSNPQPGSCLEVGPNLGPTLFVQGHDAVSQVPATVQPHARKHPAGRSRRSGVKLAWLHRPRRNYLHRLRS